MKKNLGKIVIIGGVAAGPAAAAKAKRLNPNLDVTIFEQGEFISYGTCSMPYYVGNVIPHHEDLISYSPERFEKEKGCKVKIFHRVEEILPHRRKIIVRDLQSDKPTEYLYDQLLIATGARAKVPNPAWTKAKNVFTIKNLRDSIEIKKFIETRHPQNAVIIGGGLVGMEMAEAFAQHHLNITVLHKAPMPVNTMEAESQKIILDELQKHHVRFVGNVTALDIQTENGMANKVVTNHQPYNADLVLLALGFEPNSELAREINIRCGKFSGIITDARMRTNLDNIFAAGACAEIKNMVSNKYIYLPLGNIANKMGWVAGENMAGGLAEFPGVVRTTAVKIFDLEVASVGLSQKEAESSGFKVVTEAISAYSRVKEYPGSKPVFIKFIIDQHSKRLIGANLIAEEGAAMRANILSVAIQNKMTIKQIAHLDMMYTPAFSPVWDPILVAANKSLKKL
jgi:NADPH-dependent 2,4-dienoyl-CoA reductase/sulfur reductase-like enzyme